MKYILLLISFIGSFFVSFSQSKLYSIYSLNPKSKFFEDLKKELEVFLYYNQKIGEKEYVIWLEENNSCTKQKYRIGIDPLDFDYPIKGILQYSGQHFYLSYYDSCIVNDFFKPKGKIEYKDPILTQMDSEDSVAFDDSGFWFYFLNVVYNDKLFKIIGSTYDDTVCKFFRKPVLIPKTKIRVKSGLFSDSLYFKYYVLDSLVNFSFFTVDTLTEAQKSIIIQNFKKTKGLTKSGNGYLGKIIKREDYIIIDYKYLNYVR